MTHAITATQRSTACGVTVSSSTASVVSSSKSSVIVNSVSSVKSSVSSLAVVVNSSVKSSASSMVVVPSSSVKSSVSSVVVVPSSSVKSSASSAAPVASSSSNAADPFVSARNLYGAQCAGCHGANGSGGMNTLHLSTKYTLATFNKKIHDTMPLGNAALCSGATAGTCAYDIANMILSNQWFASVQASSSSVPVVTSSSVMSVASSESSIKSSIKSSSSGPVVASSSSAIVASSSISTTSSSVAANVLASLEIAPGATSLAVNGTQQLVAVGKLGNGNLVNMYGKVTSSVSSGAGVVSINSTGLLKRLTAGNAVIQATAQGKTTTLSLTDTVQAFTLKYDNSTSKWAKVSVHLWTGASPAVAPWPGTPMTNNNGVWTYTVSPSALVNGKINVIFNNGEKENTLKTGDLLNVAGASTYKDGVLTAASGSSGGATALVSVIDGAIKSGGTSFPSGTVLTIKANTSTAVFSGWAGASAAYIFTDPSKPEAQIVVPSGTDSMSLQALYTAVVDTHKAARTAYASQCVTCHGVNGKNGRSGSLDMLSSSNKYTLTTLINKISTTMPLSSVGSCTGNTPDSCAYDIASMILANKWVAGEVSTTAEGLDSRNLRLLTTEEYLNSARDILGVNFDAAIMTSAVGDSTARNFNTASTIALDYDRTVGYQIAAKEIAKKTIAAKSFYSLVSGCGASDTTCVVTGLGKKVFRPH